MTNEEMTQHTGPSATEQSPVSDENPTPHGSGRDRGAVHPGDS